jgi:succinyl-diaminopimelate desuccinylase
MVEAITLLQKLVAFDTDVEMKKEYQQCADFLAQEGKKQRFTVKQFSFKDEKGRNCPSVVLEKNLGFKETVLLAMHYDIVPAGTGWNTNPFKLTIKKGKAYGRGATDDKGAIAATLAATAESHPKRNIKILFSCDEEIGGTFGTKKLKKKDIDADWAFIADTGTDKISLGVSGRMECIINLQGKSAHAAYPFKTQNILHKAIPFLEDVLQFQKKFEKKKSKLQAPKNPISKNIWRRLSVTVMQAGNKSNSIPDAMQIKVDIRLLPEDTAEEIQAIVQKNFQRLLEKNNLKGHFIFSGGAGAISHISKTIITQVRKQARKQFSGTLPDGCDLGGSDASRIEKLGIPTIGFGPFAKGSNVHAPNEFISLTTLKKMQAVIKGILEM